MSRDDLIALIARVETANIYEQRSVMQAALGALKLRPDLHCRAALMIDFGAYESAAMTLVPDGWFLMLGCEKGGRSAGASLTEHPAWQSRGRDAGGTAATPALAITLAALQVKLAEVMAVLAASAQKEAQG
jgi:hypothetical protein